MRRASLWLAVVAATLASHAAAASEQSQRLYSRGLVDFHAERYPKALELFEQAVQADTSDPYALYYRGVTRGRLGDYAGAVTDLRAAMAAKPDFDQAALELGVALVHEGRHRDALPLLMQAQRLPDAEAKASLFLAIAQLNLGQLDAARQSLERAKRDPTLQNTARYYEGIVAYRQERWDQAAEHFAYVAGASPDSEIGREAAAFLSKLRRGERRPYTLFGSLGFQYDSNVVLAPSEEAIKTSAGISKQADGRVTIDAGGAYVPWRTEHAQLSVGYEFFQSLHFDLTSFNLEDHRLSAQIAGVAGPVQLGLFGRYDYYFLSTDSFLQEANATPWLSMPEAKWGRTELSYRVRRRDFITQAFRLRDAFNHAASVHQLLYLDGPDRYLAAGYRFDREDPIRSDPESASFAYDGHEVDTGIGWAFPAAVSAEIDYAFRYEDYDPASHGRHDEVHEVVVLFRKALTDYLDATAGYFGTINNSNQALFHYDRHIGSLALEARY